ncbi:MAG: hypothetical protein J2P46_03340, partial [Zavarzinella sp.]|nr:hypothetical protein [Zavarzinella sp.]
QPLPLNEDPNSLNAFRDGVKNDWVFGFERPRVNINEALVRIQNDPSDPLKDPNTGMAKATLPYDMTMWLELHNPLTPDAPAEQFSGTEGFVPTVPPNPPNNDDNIHGGYRAALKDTFTGAGDKSVYRVLVYKAQPWMAGPDPLGMRGYDNVAGVPTTATYQSAVLFTTGGDTVDTKGNSKGQQVIEPNLGAQYRDESFFLVGPQLDQKMGAGPAQLPTDPAPAESTANLTTKALQTKIPTTDFTIGAPPGWAPGFVLQRLACPALPPGQNNPYVTIDYFESDPVAINHRLKYDGQGNPGDPANAGNEPDWNTTYSWGRRQPYDGTIVYGDAPHYQQKPGGMQAPAGKINYTFGQHNGGTAMGQNQWPQQGDNTLQLPFNPLAHFDRTPLSPADLFHVVGTKPTEFTHVFRGPPSDPNNGLSTTGRLKYTADWLDHQVQPGQQGSFLYRALGLLRTQTSLDGLGMGGRVPGKININTIFNQAVFDAICDAQTGVNRFQQGAAGQAGTVGDAWKVLIAGRQAGAGGPTQMQIGPNDKPLRGYAISSIQDQGAILDRYRTAVTPDMLWSQSDATQSKENYAPGVSPAGRAADIEKYEMISKVMNQFTTRSNTFAVYMMIGYFEVKNPGPYNEANRPILGKELGTDDGTVVRHKYFAVIDRTNLSIEPTPLVVPTPGQSLPPIKQGQPPVYFSFQPDTPLPQAPNYQITGTEDPLPTGASPPAPIQIRVPAVGQVMNPAILPPNPPQPLLPPAVSGQYDGTLWTIQAGVSQLEIDVGERKETVIVPSPSATIPNPVVFDPSTSSALITIQPTMPHMRGAAMRLTNPDPSQPPSTPGNPGPQPGFNYKSPRYAPVVKYVEQLR